MSVLSTAFEQLIADDERAFRTKFRKMAADPFAFYRGHGDLPDDRGGGQRPHRAANVTVRPWAFKRECALFTTGIASPTRPSPGGA